MRNVFAHDLAQGPAAPVDCDICVIGAGPVGLTVARGLAALGRSVTLLERGPAPPIVAAENGVNFDRLRYRGATLGRAFGAGGTSALWGGQLLPVRAEDLEERPQIGAPAWPVPYGEIAAQFPTLEAWLCVQPGTFGREFAAESGHPLASLGWQDWSPRFSKWIPFGRRNLHRAFATALRRTSMTGMLNACVCEWRFRPENDRQRLVSVTARSAAGHQASVRAKAYVICAGALESARCVLEMSEAAGPLSDGVRDLAGRFLSDHLSLRLARVAILDRAAFQNLFAPVFDGNTLRSLRMELSGECLLRDALPALYAHFVMETNRGSGFALLRDVFRGMQQGSLRQLAGCVLRLAPALPGIADLVYQRYGRRRLPFPRGAQVYMQCDFEQSPLRENRLYLGAIGPDGRRAMHLDWGVDGAAQRVAAGVQTALSRFWSANGLDEVARLEPIDHGSGGALDPVKLHDIYHPSGTTRMSADPAAGVVDPNLLIHGTSNAYVAGSAVFPSMGAANPTFTAMALGLRLVEFIDGRLPGAAVT